MFFLEYFGNLQIFALELNSSYKNDLFDFESNYCNKMMFIILVSLPVSKFGKFIKFNILL